MQSVTYGKGKIKGFLALRQCQSLTPETSVGDFFWLVDQLLLFISSFKKLVYYCCNKELLDQNFVNGEQQWQDPTVCIQWNIHLAIEVGNAAQFEHVQNITSTDFLPVGCISLFACFVFFVQSILCFLPRAITSFSVWLEVSAVTQQKQLKYVFKVC